MGLDFLRARRRAKPIDVAINRDYSEPLIAGMFRSLFLKLSGIYTGSGTGVNALDGPFGLLGKVEIKRGSDVVLSMHGSCLRHLTAMLVGAQGEILPANPVSTAGAPFLAQCEIPFHRLLPEAAIDGRREDLTVSGRFLGLTNLGSTVTGITQGKLRISGKTTAVPNGDHFEPSWVSQTVDISTTSSEIVGKKVIGNDFEVCAGIFLRVHDLSAIVAGPNDARADGLVRTIRIELESDGKVKELGRWTWGELKAMLTTEYGLASTSGQIQSGVALVLFDDPETPELQESVRMKRGDVLTVFVDTATTVEDEFTAVTPATGDLLFWTPLSFVPRGPGTDAARAQAARDANLQRRISEARRNAQNLVG